ncbi:hypothetical protein TheetDRAFT_3112, partial [Thermoanaerobacter ethanolicus JW 200]
AAESKDLYDSKTLIPSLKEFFNLHPNFSYRYFLGDAGFDSFDNYKYLFSEHGIIPIIPINPRNSKTYLSLLLTLMVSLPAPVTLLLKCPMMASSGKKVELPELNGFALCPKKLD